MYIISQSTTCTIYPWGYQRSSYVSVRCTHLSVASKKRMMPNSACWVILHDFAVIEIKLATRYKMKSSYLAIQQENAFLCHNLDLAHQ